MKKKYGVLIGLVAVLAIAVFVNVRINKAALDQPKATLKIDVNSDATAASAGAEQDGEYFEVFRTDRENTREVEISFLDAIINDEMTDAETLADAQQQKLAIVDSIEKEFTVESLLKAKGFLDVAVTVHAGSVNVIIKSDELSEKQVAQVLDIVCRETGESAQNIKIQPIGTK